MNYVSCRRLTSFLRSKGYTVSSMRIHLQTKQFVIFTFKEKGVLKQGRLDKFSQCLVFDNFSYNVFLEIDKLLKEVFSKFQC